MKSKITKTASGFSVSGGKGKMFGKSGVAPSKEGVSAPPTKPSFDKKAPAGGRSGVMGKQGGSRPAEAGKVSPSKSGGGSNSWGVHGGKGKMAGNTGSTTARVQ
jgi:hypothetical protein